MTNAPEIELVLVPRAHDVGGFEVRRALPAKERQMVGPFIFFDQMGPGEFLQGTGLDVRPHPHIGLSTVTYLFEGSIQHRDSLGSDQPIVPGDVNWMTAGQGIVPWKKFLTLLSALHVDVPMSVHCEWPLFDATEASLPIPQRRALAVPRLRRDGDFLAAAIQ